MNPSETRQMTLTDFLLARIAEDEEWESANRHFGDGSAPKWVPAWWTRVLAECEAKRNLVERYRKSGHPALYLALADFSLAYADHPDFREEWRA